MHIKPLRAVLCATALLCATSSVALENDQRWYVSGMFTGIDADGDRGADDDFGGAQLAVGKNMGDQWSVELTAVGARFEDASTQLARQWGFGLDFLAYFWRTQDFQPYAVVGGGYLVTDNKRGRQDEDGGMINLGVGFKMPIVLGMEFRTDLRVRRDYGGPSYFDDYLWNIGINIPVSGRRVDVTQYDEGAAASGAGPSYQFVADSDGDGFLDPEDRCPATPGGERVNEFGCSASDDSDGDNVPNSDDMCGDTPAGEPVDKYGCRVTPPSELSVPSSED